MFLAITLAPRLRFVTAFERPAGVETPGWRGLIQRTETPPSSSRGSGRSTFPTGQPAVWGGPGFAPRSPCVHHPGFSKGEIGICLPMAGGTRALLKGDHPEVSGERAPCAISAEITAHCWLPGNILDQHRCGSRGEFSRHGCPAASGAGQTHGPERGGGNKKKIKKLNQKHNLKKIKGKGKRKRKGHKRKNCPRLKKNNLKIEILVLALRIPHREEGQSGERSGG